MVQTELGLARAQYGMDLYRIDKKIEAIVQIFEERRMILGLYYEYAVKNFHF
jgi:hypothetical protein